MDLCIYLSIPAEPHAGFGLRACGALGQAFLPQRGASALRVLDGVGPCWTYGELAGKIDQQIGFMEFMGCKMVFYDDLGDVWWIYEGNMD